MALQSSTAHLPPGRDRPLGEGEGRLPRRGHQLQQAGNRVRTRTYTVLMVIAWTALFHAVFHRRGKKPWYVAEGDDPNVRYQKIDGEPKHWELAEAIRRYYGGEDTPARRNLEFMVALRNKIEHRDHPELDPACSRLPLRISSTSFGSFGLDYPRRCLRVRRTLSGCFWCRSWRTGRERPTCRWSSCPLIEAVQRRWRA